MDTTCENFPEPPDYTNLVRADEKQRLRLNDRAYFLCSNPIEMVISVTGTNMFSATCNDSKASTIDWQNCTYDPVCDSMPLPSNDSELILSYPNTKVKLGQYVRYECKNKKELACIVSRLKKIDPYFATVLSVIDLRLSI